MDIQTKKLALIQRLIKIESDTVLSRIEALLESSPKLTKGQKLSEKYAGSLHLTDEQYQDLYNQVAEGRTEWERDI